PGLKDPPQNAPTHVYLPSTATVGHQKVTKLLQVLWRTFVASLCASLSAETGVVSHRPGNPKAMLKGDRQGDLPDAPVNRTVPLHSRSPKRIEARFAPVGQEGGRRVMRKVHQVLSPVLLVCCAVVATSAQSFRVQCPNTTTLHTSPGASAAYTGPTSRVAKINQDGGTAINVPYVDNGGAIKCQQISGGDGYATMGDGPQPYLFAFGPLSGLNDLANGQPATELNTVFNTPYDPAAAPGSPASNGAVGLATADI